MDIVDSRNKIRITLFSTYFLQNLVTPKLVLYYEATMRVRPGNMSLMFLCFEAFNPGILIGFRFLASL